MLVAGKWTSPLGLVIVSPGRGDRKLLSQNFAVQEMEFCYSSLPTKIKYLQMEGNIISEDVCSGLPAEVSSSSL